MHAVDLTPVTAPVGKQRTHVVSEGESARSIALHYYKNPLMARQVLAQNGGSIQVGDVLRLP